jgi:hypothetical protein
MVCVVGYFKHSMGAGNRPFLWELSMDIEFIYTPIGTDISVRWRKAGWIPPSEQPEIQAKWALFREAGLRKLEGQTEPKPEKKTVEIRRVR